MANVNKAHGFTAVRTLYGSAIPIFRAIAKASQSWKPGDVLVRSIGTGTIRIIGTIAEVPFGIAVESVNSVAAGTIVQYVPILPQIVFSVQTGAAAITAALLGTLIDIQSISAAGTGVMAVSPNKSAQDTVRVLQMSTQRNTSIGLYGEVEVVFNKTVWTTGLSA